MLARTRTGPDPCCVRVVRAGSFAFVGGAVRASTGWSREVLVLGGPRLVRDRCDLHERRLVLTLVPDHALRRQVDHVARRMGGVTGRGEDQIQGLAAGDAHRLGVGP